MVAAPYYCATFLAYSSSIFVGIIMMRLGKSLSEKEENPIEQGRGSSQKITENKIAVQRVERIIIYKAGFGIAGILPQLHSF